MIPQEIIRFLDGATLAFAGSRDNQMKPYVHFLTGWLVSEDLRNLTFFTPAMFVSSLLRNLEDNGQIAVIVTGSTTGPKASNPPRPHTDAHETYQFKGDYVSSRSIEESDLRIFEDCKERAIRLHIGARGFPAELADLFFPQPSLAITFQVREIFDQTPGPNAGHRIAPPEES